MFTIRLMSTKYTIFERLLQAAKAIKGIETQAELARHLNVLEQNLTNWKSRGVPKNVILDLSEKWNVKTKWLTTREGQMSDEPPLDPFYISAGQARQNLADYGNLLDLKNNADYPPIRRVNIKLSAGIAGYSVDYDVEDKSPIVMGKEWFEKRGYIPSKLLATKVKGDSMMPGINDSDTVVINTLDLTPVDGVVFAINYEGELLVKRMIRDAGVWWLSSDNPDQRKHPRKQCEGDLCIIIGRIVHKQSEVI